MVSVELDIYSGRLNPSWNLSEEDAKSFTNWVSTLRSSPPAPIFDGLGYRGFIVKIGGAASSAATTVRIYHNVIQSGVGDHATYYVDTDRRLEQFLLDSAKAVLDGETYDQVMKEIKAQ